MSRLVNHVLGPSSELGHNHHTSSSVLYRSSPAKALVNAPYFALIKLAKAVEYSYAQSFIGLSAWPMQDLLLRNPTSRELHAAFKRDRRC